MIDTITLIFLLCSAFIKSEININYLTCIHMDFKAMALLRDSYLHT